MFANGYICLLNIFLVHDTKHKKIIYIIAVQAIKTNNSYKFKATI